MKELTSNDIREKALGYNSRGAKWHFHILTPNCTFNKKPLYAFILEGPGEVERYVCYSKDAPTELGAELAPLAYKAKVLDTKTTDSSYQPSETVQKIISRAKELSGKKVEWHHHVLFPGCQFNSDSRYRLIFEDPESGETIESVSDREPTNDLKQIEPLFYSQKK